MGWARLLTFADLLSQGRRRCAASSIDSAILPSCAPSSPPLSVSFSLSLALRFCFFSSFLHLVLGLHSERPRAVYLSIILIFKKRNLHPHSLPPHHTLLFVTCSTSSSLRLCDDPYLLPFTKSSAYLAACYRPLPIVPAEHGLDGIHFREKSPPFTFHDLVNQNTYVLPSLQLPVSWNIPQTCFSSFSSPKASTDRRTGSSQFTRQSPTPSLRQTYLSARPEHDLTMKAGLFTLAAAALLHLVVAQSHGTLTILIWIYNS